MLAFSLCSACITWPGVRPSSAMRLRSTATRSSRAGYAQALGGAHAVDGLQGVLELARIVLELAVGRVFAKPARAATMFTRPGASLAHFELRDLRRQVRAQRVHLARDLVILLVSIGARIEFDRTIADAIRMHRRLDLLHIIELGEPVLDRLRHQPLQVLRVRARVDRRDDESRES